MENEDPTRLSPSTLMCLNVITDLCRLLSRGYSHLYHVFSIINASTLSTHIANDLPLFETEEFVPLTLFEQLSQQYTLYITQSTMESEHSNNFYYMRYLQILQKVVYLVIIDDYLAVGILFYLHYSLFLLHLILLNNGLRIDQKSQTFFFLLVSLIPRCLSLQPISMNPYIPV